MAYENEIRIFNVPPALKKELENIAKHSGIPLPQLLKPKLRDIANSYPDFMRTSPPKKDV